MYNLRFETCYDARSSTEDSKGCGSIGLWWEEYVHYREPPRVVGGRQHTADALLAELEGRREE